MDSRQKRREALGADKPVKKSNTTFAGSPVDMLVPAPGLKQNPNHQALNPINQKEQPAGNLSVDGTPRQHPFGDSFQENDGRDGYVSNNVPPSGARQGMTGYRGQNLMRDQGLVMDTDASAYAKLDMDYNGMQAMQTASKNYAAAENPNPSYNLGGMGMMGSPATAMNPQLAEPPPRIGQELGLYGTPSAEGANLGRPVGDEMTPGKNKTVIRKKGKK